MIPLIYTLVILILLTLPLALAAAFRRRFLAPWYLFAAGMATFVGSQVVHLPLNGWLERLGWLPSAPFGPDAILPAAVLLGLTSGLCEELARAVGYWFLRHNRRIQDGLMAGLGHGGIEAMIVGGVLLAASFTSLWSLRSVDLQTLNLSAAQAASLQQQMDMFLGAPWAAFAPLLERLLAMLLHVVLSLLVLQAFRRRNPLYLVAAIAYHALTNGLLVYALHRTESVALTEGLFALLVLPGLVWAWRLWSQAEKTPMAQRTPLRQEIRLFGVSLVKELKQQARTHRLLVVAAVFAFFGLTSPLLARFTPELLNLIEGAEQFADLIPTPTGADALGQYVKNLSQFGFIIAILVGMGAVVGEKETGTAAMILSKPLPRWAFVTSKFAAQAAVYAVAFLLAAAGAYLYTAILFGAAALAPFLLLNLLLLLWLLVFVALTLLASVWAPGTGAAAGAALGGAVLLLLAGSLPRVGGLFPGGLMAWAGQLAAGGQAAANGGAVGLSLLLILVFLVLSLAVFERQEL